MRSLSVTTPSFWCHTLIPLVVSVARNRPSELSTDKDESIPYVTALLMKRLGLEGVLRGPENELQVRWSFMAVCEEGFPYKGYVAVDRSFHRQYFGINLCLPIATREPEAVFW
jgi:hypothetical protein